MRSTLVLLIVLLVTAAPLIAKSTKANKDLSNHQMMVEQASQFSPAERHVIRTYLDKEQWTEQGPGRQLPQGLQKQAARGKSLPPGWQKKIKREHSLDYHIYRQGRLLPTNLLDQLPPAPAGTEIIQVEDTILRLNTATRTVLDLFQLVPTR